MMPSSGRRTAGKRGPRVLLLLSALCSTVPSSLAQSWTWTCHLDSVPVQEVPLPAPQKIQNVDDGGRRLRLPLPGSEGDVAARPRDEDVAHAEGRRCACADWILEEEAYYCPLPADRCAVSRTRYGAHAVKCYVASGWQVGLARHVWLYLCFMLLLLVVYPCAWTPGRHAVRYLLSRCIPGMNDWIAEHLLRAEIEGRNLTSEEFERFARRKRQTEGWISEYRIKTKLYSREGETAEGDGKGIPINDNDADLICEGDCETAEGNGMKGENAYDEEDEDGICTICLMAVEDGERIPDLDCGHLFHADCLSEWILKKNSCPLCSGPVAREVRSFEADPPADNVNDEAAGNALSRLRIRVRGGLLDLATGSDRRGLVANRNRIRRILNER